MILKCPCFEFSQKYLNHCVGLLKVGLQRRFWHLPIECIGKKLEKLNYNYSLQFKALFVICNPCLRGHRSDEYHNCRQNA